MTTIKWIDRFTIGGRLVEIIREDQLGAVKPSVVLCPTCFVCVHGTYTFCERELGEYGWKRQDDPHTCETVQA